MRISDWSSDVCSSDLDGLVADPLAGADQGDQLLEEPFGQGDLGRLAVEGDLVAAHVDVGVEGLLDPDEVFVVGPEQADPVDARGHDYRVMSGRRAGGRPVRSVSHTLEHNRDGQEGGRTW